MQLFTAPATFSLTGRTAGSPRFSPPVNILQQQRSYFPSIFFSNHGPTRFDIHFESVVRLEGIRAASD